MAELIAGLLNSTELLFDLQRAGEIAQQFSGCRSASEIACITTDGLVKRFGCAFARIWLVEPDQTSLRLVASSGLYTRIDGSFARVPMGAYKVGKIAQNRVSFLSNNLAEESWVKDREWAIANRIRGFAGFPLTVQDRSDGTPRDRVIGVLATFSHEPLSAEFLEVLRVLCTMVSVALDTALYYEQHTPAALSTTPGWHQLALSDQLAAILGPVRLTLIGTEQPLSLSQTCLFLQVADVLNRLGCRYCRLLYQGEHVELEAIVPTLDGTIEPSDDWLTAQFGTLRFMTTCLGGQLQSRAVATNRTASGSASQGLQISLTMPRTVAQTGYRIHIACQQPLLHIAFTHLAHTAGVEVVLDAEAPLLTDALTPPAGRQIIWVSQPHIPVPPGVSACLTLSTTPEQLRDALAHLAQGKSWGLPASPEDLPTLSDREKEILNLLATGLRDRDIAQKLIISESTVKFHVNNVLSKLKARTRFQALNLAIRNGWI